MPRAPAEDVGMVRLGVSGNKASVSALCHAVMGGKVD